jgi:hypothetical protein
MIKYLSVLLIALFLLSAGAAGAADKDARIEKADKARGAEVDKTDAFQQSKDWKKLGDSLKQAYISARAAGFPKQRIRCFVLSRDPINPGDRSFLNSKGFNVQIVSGRTARGTLDPKDLPDITQLFFVQKISMAKEQ